MLKSFVFFVSFFSVSIKIEKDDELFTKNEFSEPISKVHSSDNEDNDVKPQRSRSPSQT